MGFQDLLSREAGTIEPPKPQPAGSYIWQNLGYKFDKTKPKDGKQPTDFVSFNVAPIAALDDVDAEAVRAWHGDQPMSKKTKNLDFYITEDALYRLQDFLVKDLGGQEGKPLKELLEETKGNQFLGMVAHAPSKQNPEIVYANITQTAPVPA